MTEEFYRAYVMNSPSTVINICVLVMVLVMIMVIIGVKRWSKQIMANSLIATILVVTYEVIHWRWVETLKLVAQDEIEHIIVNNLDKGIVYTVLISMIKIVLLLSISLVLGYLKWKHEKGKAKKVSLI